MKKQNGSNNDHNDNDDDNDGDATDVHIFTHNYENRFPRRCPLSKIKALIAWPVKLAIPRMKAYCT